MTAMPTIESQTAYTHNGQPISAEDFDKIACDPRRNVAVEASAGVDTTGMLVSRIVQALLDGLDAKDEAQRVQPHEILVITASLRAATEIRERLYQSLADFASGEFKSQNGLYGTSHMREQLSNLYQTVLTSGRPVQVLTIHRWFAALLHAAPLALLQQLEWPANYALLEDDAPAKAQVWPRFYTALVADDPRSTALKADFEALVFEHGLAQTEKALHTALDQRAEFALADAHGVVEASVVHFCDQYPDFVWLEAPDDYLSAQPQRWQTLLAAAKALRRASAKTFAAKGVALEKALAQGDLSAAFDALLTLEGSARKFGEKITGIERVREAQNLVLRVVAARQQHSAWTYQQRMTRLTRLLLNEFAALKREHGWVDMNDVDHAARALLGDPVLLGWVQAQLDVRVKHLLMDEFQDSKPVQWLALRAWLRGNARAAAPSVFIVGDPKQSIDRLQQTAPQVFKAAQAFVQDTLGGDWLSCDHSRHHATGIVACVNAVMNDAALADGDAGFRTHTTGSSEPGDVWQLPTIPQSARQTGSDAGEWRDSLTTPREIPDDALRHLEADQAAHWIAQHLRRTGLQPCDVMVLSRQPAGLKPLQTALRQQHITAQVGKKTTLIDCCEVQDVVALLEVLLSPLSPSQDLSLARVLKSPLFGMDDAALVQLALAQRDTHLPWLDLLQKTELLTHDGRWLAAVLSTWKGWLNALPLHHALQAIYTDGDVLARFAAAAPAHQREAVLTHLRTVLGASLSLGSGGCDTPLALVRALKAGKVQASVAVNPLAVRLLTVREAKGLQAHTVLLLDTDPPERTADTMGVRVDWPDEAEWPQKFVFLASESQPPVCAVPLLEAERLARQRNELNALYLALTRARHTLVVSRLEPYRAAERSGWQRLVKFATPAPPLQATPAPNPSTLANPVFYLKELPRLEPRKDTDNTGQ